MKDTKFSEIIRTLKEVHKIRPDMKFGQVIQLSIDYHLNKKNFDLTQTSSKKFLKGLNDFKNKITGEQK